MDFKSGVEMVMTQGSLIAMFPVEKWLADLERQDTVAPILDPTAYREYLYSGRREMLLEVLGAAVALKSAIVKAQAGVQAGKIK